MRRRFPYKPVSLVFMILVVSLLFTIGCDGMNPLGMIDPGTTDSGENCTGHGVLSADGLRYDWFDCNDNLLWYEIYTKDSNGKKTKIERFLPAGVLEYTLTYEYDSEGNKILYQRFTGEGLVPYESFVYGYENGQLSVTARYKGDNSLDDFTHTIYDVNNNVSMVVTYSADGAITNITEKDTNSAGDLDYYATYEKSDITIDLLPVGYETWQYDSSDRVIKQMTWSGSSTPANITYGDYPDQSTAAIVTAPSGTDYAIPVPRSTPVITRPTLSEADADKTELWTYDDYGHVYAEINGDQRPVTVVRKDTRLQQGIEGLTAPLADGTYIDEVQVTFGYWPNDGSLKAYKLTNKTITWGNTELGTVAIQYDDGGYVQKIHTNSILINNFDIEIIYHPDRALDAVCVLVGDLLIDYFVYEAASDPSGEAGHPLDPTGLTGQILSIKHYQNDDGSTWISTGDSLLETFVFDYDYGEQLKIDVMAPGNDPADPADDVSNGYFLVTQNSSGQTVGLSSYSAAEVLQWSYSYNYAEVLGESIRLYEEKINQLGAEANTLMSFIGDPFELLF